MRIFLAMAAMLVPLSAASAQYQSKKSDCPNGPLAVSTSGKGEHKRLGDLPAGALVMAVYRTENGCPKPMIVRQGIGSVAKERGRRSGD